MASGAGLSKSHRREVWRDALDRAAIEVFEALLGIRLESVTQNCPLFEFTATVGLAGELRGVISLSCNRETAVAATQTMLQADHIASEAQVWDALGEICNVLAGRFKNGPPRIAENCMLSVPTVIAGSNYKRHPLAGARALERYFRLQNEIIMIVLAAHEVGGGS